MHVALCGALSAAFSGNLKDWRSKLVMHRCCGLTRTLHQCSRTGNWRFFCGDHHRQPLVWISFLIFTVVAGFSSIYSAWWRGNARDATSQAPISQIVTTPESPNALTSENARLAIEAMVHEFPAMSPLHIKSITSPVHGVVAVAIDPP